jgi:hypothetical protein
MVDWTLEEVLCICGRLVDTRFWHCPRCGAGLECRLHLRSPFLGTSETASTTAKCLSAAGLGSVHKLLDCRPLEACRRSGLHLDDVVQMRGVARWWLLDRAHNAAQKLAEKHGWGQDEIDKLGPAVATALAFGNENNDSDQIEVVVEMRDQLPYERLIELPAAQQVALRRAHANASQAELTRSFELGADRRTYLQIWLSNQFVASLSPFDIQRAAQRPDVSRRVALISPASITAPCFNVESKQPGVPHFSHLRSGPRHSRQHSLVTVIAHVIQLNSRIKLDTHPYNSNKKKQSKQARRPTTYNSSRQP